MTDQPSQPSSDDLRAQLAGTTFAPKGTSSRIGEATVDGALTAEQLRQQLAVESRGFLRQTSGDGVASDPVQDFAYRKPTR